LTAWLRIAAAGLGAAALGQPATAATSTRSFQVSATVVATCSLTTTVNTGQASVSQPTCARRTTGASQAVVAPPPVVKVTRDPKTGVLVKTIEF
jgi:hypothetical protein